MFYASPFSELSLVGLALDLVNYLYVMLQCYDAVLGSFDP